MSVHYKAVLNGLNDYQALLQGKIPRDPGAAREQAAVMVEKLGSLLHSVESYIAQHQHTPAKAMAVRAMETLQSEILKEISLINSVAQRIAGKGGVEGMTWGSALTGAGYRLMDSISRHHDGLVNMGESVEKFGEGAVSQVALLVYGGGDSTREIVFKPDPPREQSDGVARTVLVNVGIDREKPSYAARNVATAFVNEALGLKNAPHCGLALHNERIGMAMDRAPGKSVQSYLIRELGPEAEQMFGNYSPEELKEMRVSKQDGKWIEKIPKIEISKVSDGDPDISANLQKELSNLEWLDGICGQYDRHAENYLVHVDPQTKKVTVSGIDNDFPFGTKPESLTGQFGKSVGLPKLIDLDMFERLQKMDFDRDLAPTLGTLLSDAEVASAKLRFVELQKHALTLEKEGKVVSDWKTWKDGEDNNVDAFLKKAGPTASYYGREMDSERAVNEMMQPQVGEDV